MKPCPLNLGCRLLAQDLSSLNHLAFSWNGRVAGGEGKKSRGKDGSTAGKKAVGRRKSSSDPRAHLAPTYPSLPTASSLFFSFLTLTHTSLSPPVESSFAVLQAHRDSSRSFEAFAYRATLNFNPLLFEE